MMKRVLSFLLVLALALGCAGFAAAEVDKSSVIKVFVPNQATDLNNEYPAQLLEELTGYKVEYYYYGDENALMMEMSSGEANYDLVQVEAAQFQTLLGKNAIKDMSKAVEKYPEILENLYEPVVAYASTEDGGSLTVTARLYCG